MAKCWLVPCSIKGFNIVEHLKTNNSACLKRNRSIAVGDTVYIYVAKPYSEILYKGTVIKSGMHADSIEEIYRVDAPETATYFEFEVDKHFDDHRFTLDIIKNAEIGQVVNQQNISGRAFIKITDIENR